MSDRPIPPAELSVDALNKHIRTIGERVRSGAIVSLKDSDAVHGAVTALMAHIVSITNEGNALRAQVEALKGAPADERASIIAFLRARRDTLKNDIARRQLTRAATDVENGADHA